MWSLVVQVSGTSATSMILSELRTLLLLIGQFAPCATRIRPEYSGITITSGMTLPKPPEPPLADDDLPRADAPLPGEKTARENRREKTMLSETKRQERALSRKRMGGGSPF